MNLFQTPLISQTFIKTVITIQSVRIPLFQIQPTLCFLLCYPLLLLYLPFHPLLTLMSLYGQNLLILFTGLTESILYLPTLHSMTHAFVRLFPTPLLRQSVPVPRVRKTLAHTGLTLLFYLNFLLFATLMTFCQSLSKLLIIPLSLRCSQL